jgi:diguanylate cyclase (GGDEF)-like protein
VDPLGPRGWLAAVAAVITGLFLGALVITLAIAAAEGRLTHAVLFGLAGIGSLTVVMSTNLALIAAVTLAADPAASVLLLFAGVGLFASYRVHAKLRRNHHGLEQVHGFARALSVAMDSDSASAEVLQQLCALMRADVAELSLADEFDATVLALRGDGSLEVATGERARSIVAARLALTRDADLASINHETPQQVGTELVGDGLLAPLRLSEGTVGTLLVGARLSDVEPFDQDDEQIFATLAAHAEVALRNHTLVERLRLEVRDREHEALHDGLTSLPNRTALDLELRRAVEQRGRQAVAVMIIDLDRFKDVNDTLGHHQGDVLLELVAARIAGATRADAFVARLGGDEFAVVVPMCSSSLDAVRVAERIESALADPFEVAKLTIDVGASIGIAMSPEHGDDADTLLQRADVAMYGAKRGPRSIEVYDANIDHYSPVRLAMAAELRLAIEHEELLVEYQPKADLRTGAVVGVEALARWHHPVHGYVPPDTFIAIAEGSGLIRSLTVLVLQIALRQNRLWRDEGRVLTTAVNLSTRSLLDETLPGTILHLLEQNDLPPSALTLEITEGTIIADPPRTIGVLNRLSAMGISLSIDDFGTGYSSLSYLKRLPVDEIKIDKSFVINMAGDENDAVIVRSTIELGRNLGLTVTAEGVESGAVWQALANLGCHQVQGYFLSRPLTSSQFARWLRERDDLDELVGTRST